MVIDEFNCLNFKNMEVFLGMDPKAQEAAQNSGNPSAPRDLRKFSILFNFFYYLFIFQHRLMIRLTLNRNKY